MNMTNIPTTKQVLRANINDYRRQMRHFIMTSRFNNTTWNENVHFREKQQKIGCIYCSPNPVTVNIPPRINIVYFRDE